MTVPDVTPGVTFPTGTDASHISARLRAPISARLANTVAILSVLLLILCATPASADHVPTRQTDTDSDAFALFVSEYQAQKDAIIETFRLYTLSESAPEKADAADAFRAGLDATILHLESIDTPPCADIVRAFVMEELDALVRFMAAPNPDLADVHLSTAGLLAQRVQAHTYQTVIDCAREDT